MSLLLKTLTLERLGKVYMRIYLSLKLSICLNFQDEKKILNGLLYTSLNYRNFCLEGVEDLYAHIYQGRVFL